VKKLLWLVIVVAALVLILPGVIGIVAERKTYEQLDLIEANPTLELTISDYDRGWFSSQVTYQYGLKSEYIDLIERSGKSPNGSDTTTHETNAKSAEAKGDSTSWSEHAAPLEILSDISHGPIGLNNGLFLGLFKASITNGPNNPRLNEFLQSVDMPYLFKGDLVSGFTGNTDFSTVIPAVNADASRLPADTGLRSLEFSGLQLNGNYQLSGAHINAKGSAENFNIVADDLSMTLQGLTFDADSSLKIKVLPFGTISFAIDEFRIFDANSSQSGPFELLGFSFTADTTAGSSDGTANFVGSYKASKALVAENVVTDMELTVRMEDLSIAATESYTQWYENLVTVDQENAEAMQQLIEGVTPIVHQFMEVSPTMIVSPLKFKTNDEPFESELTLRVDGSKLPAVQGFDVTDTGTWLSVLSGESNASISEPLATGLAVTTARSQLLEVLQGQEGITLEQINEMAVNQAPIVIETLIQQGRIQRADGKLGAQLSYGNGTLTLNGQAIPLQQFLPAPGS